MPHVTVKLWPGNTPEEKQQLSDAITQAVIQHLNQREASVSVAMDEIEPDQWRSQVYEPEILKKAQNLTQKPGYKM